MFSVYILFYVLNHESKSKQNHIFVNLEHKKRENKEKNIFYIRFEFQDENLKRIMWHNKNMKKRLHNLICGLEKKVEIKITTTIWEEERRSSSYFTGFFNSGN